MRVHPRGLPVTNNHAATRLGLACVDRSSRNSSDNQADVRAYLSPSIERPGVLAFIDRQRNSLLEYDGRRFLDDLASLSEGNFMYLHYVLPEIERGVYDSLDIEQLPRGLDGYYWSHWRRMGMTSRPLPHERITIMYVLAAIRRPWSRPLIAAAVDTSELMVQEVLDDWRPFLHEQLFDQQPCYFFYHASFRDFLYRKEVVQAARVDPAVIEGRLGLLLYERSPWGGSAGPDDAAEPTWQPRPGPRAGP